MKVLSLTIATVVLAAFSGCCGTGACVNSCDPCGHELAGGGCPLGKLLRHRTHKCHPLATYGWEGSACGCCNGGMHMTAPASAPCGCGPMNHMVAPTPAPVPAPAPVPPEEQSAPAPMPPTPGAEAAKVVPARQAISAPQQVSYEEFQRLPGVVISGPSPAPAVPPVLTPSQPAGQQTTWVPAR